MPRFLSSPNGRLFAVVNGYELTVYRHDIPLWKRTIEPETCTLLGLRNFGDWFALSSAGLHAWPHDPKAEPVLYPHLGTAAVARTGQRLGRISISADGTEMCVQFVGGPDSSRTHQLQFYDLVRSREVLSHVFHAPLSVESAQLWDLSSDFRWLAVAAATKSNTLKITLLDLRNELGAVDFSIPAQGFRGVHVTRDGTLVVNAFHQGSGRLHVLARGQAPRMVRPPLTVREGPGGGSGRGIPASHQVEFVASSYVALRLAPGPFLLFKTLADELISLVDMSDFRTQGTEWDVHYDEGEELNLLTLRDGHFRIVHSEPGRLDDDTRRRKARSTASDFRLKADEPGVPVVYEDGVPVVYEDGMPDLEFRYDERREEWHRTLSRDLIRSVQEVRQLRNAASPGPA